MTFLQRVWFAFEIVAVTLIVTYYASDFFWSHERDQRRRFESGQISENAYFQSGFDQLVIFFGSVLALVLLVMFICAVEPNLSKQLFAALLKKRSIHQDGSSSDKHS
jgi:hypothetical protein